MSGSPTLSKGLYEIYTVANITEHGVLALQMGRIVPSSKIDCSISKVVIKDHEDSVKFLKL